MPSSVKGGTPYLQDPDLTIWNGDALSVLRALPDQSIDCCVTSPPYLDRRPEYESPTVEEFGDIFDELFRVLTGCCLVNVGRIFRERFEKMWWLELLEAARVHGWAVADTLVWVKPNCNPIHGAVFADRHEYVFVLGRHEYRLNTDAIRVPYAESSVPRMQRGWISHVGVKGDASRKSARNSQPHPEGGRAPSYVTVHTGGEKGNDHPAPMPLQLAEHLVKLGCWPGESVVDPFAGSGTTAIAARRWVRRAVLIEKSAEYCALAADRLSQLSLLAEPAA